MDEFDEPEEWMLTPKEQARIERNAAFAAVAGILSHTAAMAICCSSGMLGVPAIILSITAIWMGKSALDTGVEGAVRAYALTGIITGVIGGLWSAFIMFLYCAYIDLYLTLVGSMMSQF